jgi:hypothetical protein
MSRATFALSVVTVSLLWTIGLPRAAKAEQPNSKAVPVYVLSILTDDVDDQADALTLALRARVKQAQGWSLLETPQSLETLTIALNCPPRPDTGCLQRIGDQLHADHYVWGSLAKKKGSEVAAEIHMWSRGKAQTDASESYSESLKEPGDEGLRAVAARLFAQVSGTGGAGAGAGGGAQPEGGAAGVLVVHAGTGGGSVLVDGVEKGTLDGGDGRLSVAEGSHKVTVRVPGFDAPSLTTNIKPGGEQEVSFALSPAKEGEGGEAEAQASKPFPLRKVLAYTAIGAGTILIVVAAVSMVEWISDKNQNETDRASIPSTVTDACSVTGNVPYAMAALEACNDSNDAKKKSTIAWVTGLAGLALGGTGAVLLATDHGGGDSSTGSPARVPAAKRFAVSPVLGPHEGGLRLKFTF